MTATAVTCPACKYARNEHEERNMQMTEQTIQRPYDPIRPRTKRGETVALVIERRITYQARDTGVTTDVSLAVATNLSQNGRCKAVRRFGWPSRPIPIDRIVGLMAVLTVSDLPAEVAEKIACEHRWPGGQCWAPWGSIDELRADLTAAGYGPLPTVPERRAEVWDMPGWWWAEQSLGERGGRAGER